MKSWWRLIAAFSAIALVFAAYLWWQDDLVDPQANRVVATRPTVRLPTTLSAGGVGPIRDISWTSVNPSTGEPESYFGAKSALPSNDGTLTVDDPVLEVVLDRGDRIRVVGRQGVIRLKELPQLRPGVTPAKGAIALKRGELRDARVEWTRREPAGDMTLVFDTPALAFDYDLFRLFTPIIELDGKFLDSDQVPVRVTGGDIELEGHGLRIEWNERSRRVETIELLRDTHIQVDQRILGSRTPTGLGEPGPASADLPPASGGAATRPAADAAARVYWRMLFQDAVVLRQAGVFELAGDRLEVSLPMKPGATPARRADIARSPTNPVPATGTATATNTSRPASQPAPLELFCKGRVSVLSEQGGRAAGLSPDAILATLIGEPSRGTMKGRGFQAGGVRVQTHPLRVTLTPGGLGQVLLTQDRSKLSSDSVEYDSLVQRVWLGPGTLETPVDTAKATVSWKTRGNVVLKPDGDNVRLEQVAVEGSVDIRSPRLAMTCGKATVDFPTTGPSRTPSDDIGLRAQDTVRASWVQDDGASRPLACDVLSMVPAEGGQRRLVAEGHVESADAEGKLEADRLEALVPKDGKGPPTAAVVERLRVTRTDGAGIEGAILNVRWETGGVRVDLRGAPALVYDSQGRLEANHVWARPDSGLIGVEGPGKAVFAATSRATTQPMTLAWTKSILADQAAGKVEILGDVRGVSQPAPGQWRQVGAQSLTATVSVPTTAPSGSQPMLVTTRGLGQFSRIGTASLQTLVLDASASIEARDEDAAGRTVRHLVLESDRLEYNLVARTFRLPGAGVMLLESPGGTSATRPGPDMKGKSAFAWDEAMVLDQKAGTLTTAGRVRAAHTDGQTDIRLETRGLAAKFLPVTNAAADALPGRIESLSCSSDVRVESGVYTVLAPRASYLASDGLLRAGGSPRQPARLLDRDGRVDAVFESIEWDIEAGTIRKLVSPRAIIRP